MNAIAPNATTTAIVAATTRGKCHRSIRRTGPDSSMAIMNDSTSGMNTSCPSHSTATDTRMIAAVFNLDIGLRRCGLQNAVRWEIRQYASPANRNCGV